MDLNESSSSKIKVELSLEELLILNSALNEVCNGLDQFDFDTRMGASHDDVNALLSRVNFVIDSVESGK